MRILIAAADRVHCSRIVEKFVVEGHDVLAIGTDRPKLDALVHRYGSSVNAVCITDPTSSTDVREALASLPEAWQDIDVLVNDATLSLGNGLAHNASLDDWDAMIDANCSALVSMTRAVLGGMLARNAGTILNLSAAREISPARGDSVFSATVAFVHQYTLSLIETTANSGVRVSCIAPDRDGKAALLDAARPPEDHLSTPRKRDFIATDIDIVETIYWIATLPAHINLNYLELAQTGELFSPRTVYHNRG